MKLTKIVTLPLYMVLNAMRRTVFYDTLLRSFLSLQSSVIAHCCVNVKWKKLNIQCSHDGSQAHRGRLTSHSTGQMFNKYLI